MLNKLKCWLLGHKYKCIEIHAYNDISYGGRVPSISFTRICQKCGKIHSGHVYGGYSPNMVIKKEDYDT